MGLIHSTPALKALRNQGLFLWSSSKGSHYALSRAATSYCSERIKKNSASSAESPALTAIAFTRLAPRWLPPFFADTDTQSRHDLASSVTRTDVAPDLPECQLACATDEVVFSFVIGSLVVGVTSADQEYLRQGDTINIRPRPYRDKTTNR